MRKEPEYQGRVIGFELMEKLPNGGPVKVKIRVSFKVEEKLYHGYTTLVCPLEGLKLYPISSIVGMDLRVLQVEMDFPTAD